MTFETVLEDLLQAETEKKDTTQVEPVLFLSEMGAVRMASAWRRLRRRRMPEAFPLPEGTAERWAWLWGQIEFDVVEWARISAVPLPTARRLAHVLTENRVVLPDGSLNTFAAKYVARQALKMGGAKV